MLVNYFKNSLQIICLVNIKPIYLCIEINQYLKHTTMANLTKIDAKQIANLTADYGRINGGLNTAISALKSITHASNPQIEGLDISQIRGIISMLEKMANVTIPYKAFEDYFENNTNS